MQILGEPIVRNRIKNIRAGHRTKISHNLISHILNNPNLNSEIC